MGRWLSPDPAGSIDGVNLYRMCRNNTISYYDENGLMSDQVASCSHSASFHNRGNQAIEPILPQQNISSSHSINTDIPYSCVKRVHSQKLHTDPIEKWGGKKIQSIKTSFNRGFKSLRKYEVNIETKVYSRLSPTGEEEKRTAVQERYLEFVKDKWVNKKGDNAVLRFNLPADRGNYRIELAHMNQLGMNTESLYEFQMRVGYTASSVIFFQVREPGGNMKLKGGDRPPIALRIINIFVSECIQKMDLY